MRVGIDIEDISRMSEKLAEKIATPSEKQYLSRFKEGKSQHIASLWTAKEACVKMLDKTDLSFLEIEVVHSDSGKPAIELKGEALKRFISLGLKSIDVSISHTSSQAIAIVIGC